MPSVAIQNLGCKVNQYESERIAESFESLGFELRDFREPADVYVINSCSVTADADRKSRQTVSRACRQNPDAKVVLTGCFAQLALDTHEDVAGAALLVPNDEKMRTASHVLAAFPDLMPYTSSPGSSVLTYDGGAMFPESAPGGLIDPRSLSPRPSALHRTRATLKVQDGCEYFCSFCSIAYTRSRMASRPLSDILNEARTMAFSGVREIVVTGVCVGAYGPETGSGGARLVDVLTQVADIEGIERVRLSSVQPVEVPDEMIAAIAAHPCIAPHLHLSAQSGDDTTLRAMNRPYTSAYFVEKAARLREAIPDIGLTTDLIVGFPGETEERFNNTLAFARSMRFARTHVFRYSPRQRTAAADLPDDVAPAEKERRHRLLTAVCAEAQNAFVSAQIGRVVDVLAESRGRAEGWLAGYTGNYTRVHFPSGPALRGRIVPVLLTEATPDGEAIGEPVDGSPDSPK